jgi:hypothetical protein
MCRTDMNLNRGRNENPNFIDRCRVDLHPNTGTLRNFG